MTVLYNWGYRFGSFVERRKTVLFFGLFLAPPLTALTFSVLAPSVGYSLFSPVCHQNPERSLGALPLCARCFGLYLGCGLAGLLFPVHTVRSSKRFVTIGICASIVLALLGLVFTVLDSNYLRFLTGLTLGAGFALLIKSILK